MWLRTAFIFQITSNSKRLILLSIALTTAIILIGHSYNRINFQLRRLFKEQEYDCEKAVVDFCENRCPKAKLTFYSEENRQIWHENATTKENFDSYSQTSGSISNISTVGSLLNIECFSRGPEKRIVTVENGWFCNNAGLGNKMFMMASAIGIACRNGATFMLPTTNCNEFGRYRTLFSGLATLVDVIDGNLTSSWTSIGEKNHMFFSDYELKQNSNYTVSGFRQNWRYFSNYSSTIQSVFQINSTVGRTARNVLQQARDHCNGSTASKLVGVHIRWGDLRYKLSQEYGYVIANKTFYEKAFPLMTKTLNTTDIIFIVASDSMREAKQLLCSLQDDYKIFYVEGLKSDEDFTVLSKTEHLIITGGTYGYWAAWLSGGRVIYFSGYARPGSQLTKDGYNLESAFLPTWIPLDDLPVTS